MDDRTSSPPSFVVSLLPFEKQLLARIASADNSLATILANQENDADLPRSVVEIFHRWEHAIVAKNGLKTVAKELTRLNTPTPNSFSPEQCKAAYRSFILMLGVPSDSNRYRSNDTECKNTDFEHKMLHAPDILLFLKSVRIESNPEDLSSWKIMAAMLRRHSTEMRRWLFEVPPKFAVFYEEETGFEIVNVTRMYLIQLLRPQSDLALIELCENECDLGSRFWSVCREEEARLAESRSNFHDLTGISRVSNSHKSTSGANEESPNRKQFDKV
jgi:hypothetical protein